MPQPLNHFATETSGLPDASQPELVELTSGARFRLRISPVAKRLAGVKLRMLAYAGSVPGPTLRVSQGSSVNVDVINEGDLETTVHWHGLRLDNASDGTAQTQAPMPIGGRFDYRLEFPDPGVYWYHPHIREDYGQEMGLYGNIVVVPSDPHYWPPVNRELTLVLDDILIEDGLIAPFSRSETTHTAMGRFGNTLLVNGETSLTMNAARGEVVRLYLTNTANARVFNLALPGARLKLVGGDSGRYEREELVDTVLIAPSERAVVDVLFEHAGTLALEHRTPHKAYPLGTFNVSEELAAPQLAPEFSRLRVNAEMRAERARVAPYLDTAPDKTLALVAEMNLAAPDAAASYVCPMHPEVVSSEPDRCPACGMRLVPAHLVPQASHGEHHAVSNMAEGGHHSRHTAHAHGHQSVPAPDGAGIEWEDDMVDVNRITTPANTRWKLLDRETGAEGMRIDWRFKVGDRVKIRLINEMDSDHPMQHPFHIHGAGRFLILSRNDVVEPNLAWKDTVLVRTGETVDILLEVTNPGVWMAHCHIAEHHESGMMLSFRVE